MGIFSRKPQQVTPGLSEEFQRALSEVGTLDIGAEFPTATDAQVEIMEQLWIGVVSKIGGEGSFEPRQVAAMSVLGERLVAENSELVGFIERLREIAARESARRPADPSWRSLVRNL